VLKDIRLPRRAARGFLLKVREVLVYVFPAFKLVVSEGLAKA
jgi:hypothetical protein